MRIAPESKTRASLLIILLFALAARAPFFLGTLFPLNDGGMFAQMIDDLRAHHFALPYETTYNLEHIPFCYPPVGFYFGALAQAATGVSTVEILRRLPLLFNLATVLAFYFVALELLQERLLAFCAGLLYAVLPRSGEWLTMGGGLTRSPAELFVLISVWCFLKSRHTRHLTWAVGAGLAAGAAALTHLEAGILVALSLSVLAFLTRPLRLQLPDLVVAAAVSVLVVAPWLIWTLAVHGPGPFVAAFDTRGTLGSTSTGLPLSHLIVWSLAAVAMWFLRQPPLAAWILATEVLVSRSAPTHTVIMFSLLAALLLGAVSKRVAPRLSATVTVTATALLTLAILVYYIPRHRFPNDRLRDLIFDTRTTLTADNITAMQFIAANVAGRTRFLVFNQRIDPWFEDLIGEWFPYLSRHESVYTAQGKEWLGNHAFRRAIEHITACQNIRSSEQLAALVQPANFDAMFLSGPYDPQHARCAVYLRALPGMHLAYRVGQNEIFLRNP